MCIDVIYQFQCKICVFKNKKSTACEAQLTVTIKARWPTKHNKLGYTDIVLSVIRVHQITSLYVICATLVNTHAKTDTQTEGFWPLQKTAEITKKQCKTDQLLQKINSNAEANVKLHKSHHYTPMNHTFTKIRICLRIASDCFRLWQTSAVFPASTPRWSQSRWLLGFLPVVLPNKCTVWQTDS